MVADVVMTEAHCNGKITVKDSIGMGARNLDSHNAQRVIWKGMVQNKGDVQKPIQKPHGMSYHSVAPSEGECENLLVPWALSASHIAFGSIHVKPVFAILGQSVATAASMAIDQGAPAVGRNKQFP